MGASIVASTLGSGKINDRLSLLLNLDELLSDEGVMKFFPQRTPSKQTEGGASGEIVSRF